jgi:predicted phosphoribosyltransferase
MKDLFRDRAEAGRLLADALMNYAGRDDVVVLGLPRGGIPVAYEVAGRLKAPLDVFVVRKLGAPGYHELAMGAIATGGIRVINEPVVAELGLSQAAIDEVAEAEQRELERRERLYRGHHGCPDLRGKTVILVDDGIATGSTMRAGVRAVRMQHPARLIVAVPTCAPASYSQFKRQADEVVALIIPADFHAVGQWYEDFSQTTDEEVASLLAQARQLPVGAQTPAR